MKSHAMEDLKAISSSDRRRELSSSPWVRTARLCGVLQLSWLVAVGGLVRSQTLGEALNATNRTWTTGGSASWFGQTNVSHDGAAAAQSGAVNNNQSCTLQTTVNGPGTLTFWWKVAAQA